MSFDLLAPHYRWMEPLLAGQKLQRCRTLHLPRLSPPRSALILGQGPGRFIDAFRARFPDARLTCIDSSPRMLQLARQRLKSRGFPLDRIQFTTANVLEYSFPQAHFDLVVTHFFLDCFTRDQLRDLIPRIARATTPRAQWLLSDFAIPSAGFARFRARLIHRLMYSFFRLVTRLPARALTPPDEFLRAQDFILNHRVTSNLGLLHSDLWSRST